MDQKKPAPLRPAATILLLRDGAAGLEVFMVVRHHQIDFASGALVFPGGTSDPGDQAPGLRARADGADCLGDGDLALRVTAIREAFEECGALFARPAGGPALVDGGRAAELGARYRQPLESGEIDMLAFCEAENLRLAVDQLSPFAHWITPVNMPKRFDTHFYLAPAPEDAGLSHDGRESVDSVWITPDQALADAAAKRRTVIFPTRLNLEKLAQNKSVKSALAAGRASPVVPVLPRVERHDGGRTLHIPLEAGYGAASFFIRE